MRKSVPMGDCLNNCQPVYLKIIYVYSYMYIEEPRSKIVMSDYQASYMMTVKEVCQLLHIHSNTARRWSDQGILKAYRISPRGDRRFRRDDIIRFLDEFSRNEISINAK